MAAVIVVPETDGFRLDVSHADTVWINSALGVPQLGARQAHYLAPCWVGTRRGVWRVYHILSATVGASNTEIRLGNSFVLPQPWDAMGQHRRFEYHDLAALGLEEVSPGMLRPLVQAAQTPNQPLQQTAAGCGVFRRLTALICRHVALWPGG